MAGSPLALSRHGHPLASKLLFLIFLIVLITTVIQVPQESPSPSSETPAQHWSSLSHENEGHWGPDGPSYDVILLRNHQEETQMQLARAEEIEKTYQLHSTVDKRTEGGHLRLASSPFISGDAFRSFADFLYDDGAHRQWKPWDVFPGAVVFLHSNVIDAFFRKMDPLIPNSYIVITHNSDYPLRATPPSSGNVRAWFAMDKDLTNDTRVIAVPIGIQNRYLSGVHPRDLGRIIQQAIPWSQRSILLYVNLGLTAPEREEVLEQVDTLPFVVRDEPTLTPLEYFSRLADSVFVLSPFGNGMDCYRTWEALYVGAIPIVQRSRFSEELFADLPVLVVDEWSELSEDLLRGFLRLQEQKVDSTSRSLAIRHPKLWLDFWLARISEYR